MTRWRTWLAAAAAGAALLAAGCGSQDMAPQAASDASVSVLYDTGSGGTGAGYDIGNGMEAETAEETSEPTASSDMLIYTGDVSIETLDFEDSVARFRESVTAAGGFIEEERVSDDMGYVDAISSYEDYSDARRSFSATVRIPSAVYEDFLSGTSELGRVRSRFSYVENVTAQYGTMEAQLEIYEAEYDRYLELMETLTDEQAILQLQEQLTELSVQIASLKTQMESIRTDVAYSTVTVSISEVRRYTDRGDSTFVGRLADTVSTSGREMLEFFENVLFFVILNWYRILFWGALIVLVVRLWRSRKGFALLRRKKKAPGEGEPKA